MKFIRTSILFGLLMVWCVPVILLGNQAYGADRNKSLYMVGGSTTTTWVYGMLSVWAETITPKLGGISFLIQETAGSRIHDELMANGEIDFGSSSSNIDYDAWRGEGQYKGKPYRDSLTVFPIIASAYQVVTMDKFPYRKLQDLRGKKIALGSAGSPSQKAVKNVFNKVGLGEGEYTPVFAEVSECFQMLQEGRVAAVAYATGAPFSHVIELGATHKPRLIGFTSEEIEKACQGTTARPFQITSKQYDFIKGGEIVETVAGFQTVLAHVDVPEDVVYKITKATWENWDSISNVVIACKGITLDSVPKQFKPYHPGAVKYYKEIGIDLSAVGR